jgi:mannose-1-phosphate guanylyltransferase/mannose-6-phosphate isomerase
MIAVIIAGGSGTRLWPISTPEYPKHLLKVGDDELTMLQNTYQRALQLTSKIYIVSEISQIEHIRKQLPNLDDRYLVVEPARRGTANCIALALSVIAKTEPPNEPIIFLSSDHYIRDMTGFAQTFALACIGSEKLGRITLVGVEPDFPATGFGYIKKSSPIVDMALTYNVAGFKEKPDHATARKYIRSGEYLWNSGYFVGSVATFEAAMKSYAPALYKTYESLSAHKNVDPEYLELTSSTIDYELLEHVTDLAVLPAAFDWLDLGSFADLAKAVGGDEIGNYVRGDHVQLLDVRNSFVQNDENKTIAVIGMNNCVVINTAAGILVTRKDMSQKVKDIKRE